MRGRGGEHLGQLVVGQVPRRVHLGVPAFAVDQASARVNAGRPSRPTHRPARRHVLHLVVGAVTRLRLVGAGRRRTDNVLRKVFQNQFDPTILFNERIEEGLVCFSNFMSILDPTK